MKYTATLMVYTAPEQLYQCFRPELEKSKKKRSEFEMKKYHDHVEFTITAKDSIALRATFNHITKLLTVYEKINKIEYGN